MGREAASRVFVALDVPSLEEALALAARLAPSGVRFKVGLELFCREGPQGLGRLQEVTGPVLLDLKLHDIPRTVGRAVQAVAALGVWGVTLHAAGGPHMLAAAAEAARSAGGGLRCLAVTVLTSLDPGTLQALGVSAPLEAHVADLARLARAAGCDGAVASPAEARLVRRATGPGFLVVTPGIRPAGSAPGDQARVATPRAALAAGADALVVGRPVTEAPDPWAALQAVLAELAG
jgi:orotidine-5'-phosphate decarboxylase